jgi:hypothetical protein
MMGRPTVCGKLLALVQAAVLAGLTAACFTIVADDRRPTNSSPGTELQNSDDFIPEYSTPGSPAYALTINGTPVSSRTVAVVNGQISVSPKPDAPGHLYNRGITVTLSAAPDDGYALADWSGDCSNATGDRCTLSMEMDRMVGVNFQPGAAPP